MHRTRTALFALAVALGTPALVAAQPGPGWNGDRPDRGAGQARPDDRPDQGRGDRGTGGGYAGQPGGYPGRDGGQPDPGRRGDPRFGGGPGYDRGPGPAANPAYDGRGGRDGRPGYAYGGNGNAGTYGGGYAQGIRPDWRADRRYDWRGYRDANRAQFRVGRYVAPRGWDGGYRRFAVGYRLPGFLFAQSYWLADPYAYHLPPAYGPTRWVRYYDDVLLVDLRSGTVLDAIPGFFW